MLFFVRRLGDDCQRRELCRERIEPLSITRVEHDGSRWAPIHFERQRAVKSATARPLDHVVRTHALIAGTTDRAEII